MVPDIVEGTSKLADSTRKKYEKKCNDQIKHNRNSKLGETYFLYNKMQVICQMANGFYLKTDISVHITKNEQTEFTYA